MKVRFRGVPLVWLSVLLLGAAPGAFASGAFWGASLLTASVAMGSHHIEFSLVSVLILTLGPALYACLGAWMTRRPARSSW